MIQMLRFGQMVDSQPVVLLIKTIRFGSINMLVLVCLIVIQGIRIVLRKMFVKKTRMLGLVDSLLEDQLLLQVSVMLKLSELI